MRLGEPEVEFLVREGREYLSTDDFLCYRLRRRPTLSMQRLTLYAHLKVKVSKVNGTNVAFTVLTPVEVDGVLMADDPEECMIDVNYFKTVFEDYRP